VKHLARQELESGLDEIRHAPKDRGTLDLIVRRPSENARRVLEVGELDLIDGLVGDTWSTRGSTKTADGSAHPDKQINIMSSRAIALVTAEQKDRWPLAGDQLYIDLDLSGANLPAGTRLAVGPEAVLEVTDQPHTGCAKFVARFGADAMKFVNSPIGRALNLRGINAKVVRPGAIRVGQTVSKLTGD